MALHYHARMRSAWPCFLAFLPSLVLAQADTRDPRFGFGRLEFGMTPEQARAATPGTDWEVLVAAEISGREYEIQARQVLEIGGLHYDLRLGSRYGGSHHWKIFSTTTTAGIAECESKAAALVAELERRFGLFDAPTGAIGTEVVVAVGQRSRMKTDAATDKLRGVPRSQALKKGAARYYMRARHLPETGDDPEILALANYTAARGHECEIEASLDGRTPPPAGINPAFDPERVLAAPTISFRNRSLRELGVPESPLEFLVPCNIQASDGKVGSCINGPAGEAVDPHRRLASQWALAYRLDIGVTDPEDRTMYPVEIPITLSAAEVREVDFSAGPILDLAQVRVIRNVREDPAAYFPPDPRLREMSAEIQLRCQVQADGSVICGLKPGTTSPDDSFTRAAIRFAENLEIDPVLRNGSTAVGGFIERRLHFKPQGKAK